MFRKAERRKAKLRLAITGTSGSGKTYGALQVAFGLGGRIAMIDTENGSGDLYCHLGNYDIASLTAPYAPRKYAQLIHEAEQAGYEIIIIDSLSHEWNGTGGCLDLQMRVAETSKSQNSYIAWGKVTPLHNAMFEAILSSPCHIIATMRSKTDYLQCRNDAGRMEIKKIGLAPVQREGSDYEFSTVFDLSDNHMASVSKDRTGIFDGQVFTLTQDTGKILRKWLDTGVETVKGGEA